MAIAFDAPCATRRMSSSDSGSRWRTSNRQAAGEGLPHVARRPAPVTSELLGLTQPVISHHVTILIDAGSFAPREALRVAVLLTCPLSLGALAAAAGDALHFRAWRGAGIDPSMRTTGGRVARSRSGKSRGRAGPNRYGRRRPGCCTLVLPPG